MVGHRGEVRDAHGFASRLLGLLAFFDLRRSLAFLHFG
jgi:hypothetical protein